MKVVKLETIRSYHLDTVINQEAGSSSVYSP